MSTQPRSDAAARVLRTITVVFAAATLVFFALTLGPIGTQAPYVDPVWHAVAVIACFGVPPVLGVLSLVLPFTAMRWALGGYAIAYAIVVATWVPAMTETPMPFSPWPLSITALGTVPAALAWRPWVTWVYTAFSAVLVVPVRFFAAGGGEAITVSLQDALFTLTFSSIFTALAIVAMNNGRALDVASARSAAGAARAAAEGASAREQARLDALVHDEVMTTLYYASVGSPELEESVRRQAVRAVRELGQVRGQEALELGPVAASVFAAELRQVVDELSPDVRFEVTGERSAPIPPDVATALRLATVEAVRNSLVHATVEGRDVDRSVAVSLGQTRVAILIRDDGPGFEPSRVGQRRLGIAVSIRGRLAAVPGGHAEVESSRGRGVLVSLLWSAQ